MEQATFYPMDRKAWRDWLQHNHDTADRIWLIYYKKKSGKPSVSYSDAVDEALCFGWIDSRVKSIDDEKYMQLFTRRKADSVWSKVNKEKVARLIAAGIMREPGFAIIAAAKANGSWTVLDAAEALVLPVDLEQALLKNPAALAFFTGLNRTDKRNMLQWLVMAKKPETRLQRINTIVEEAAQGRKPKPFRVPGKD